MNKNIKPGKSLLSAVVALLAVAAMPLQASAQDQQVESSSSMTVVRDAETGKLRAPTAAEHAALSQAAKAKSLKARASAAAPTLQKSHASGARGARLTDDFMSTVVAVRNADGSIGRQCLESHDDAEAAHAGHAAPTSVTE
jgi:molybdopterin-guanine dinucleotide biosynthesis protein A